jgi:glycosyltransferase involved in cell wall biosynthesis
MRILAIKRSAPTSAANGLDLPVREILRRVAAQHEVLLACWEGETATPDNLAFQTVVRPLPGQAAGPGYGGELDCGDRLLQHYGFALASVPWLAGLIYEWRPDVLVGVDYATLPALHANPSCPRVAYLIDNRYLAARQNLVRGDGSRLRAVAELIWSWRLHRRHGDAADAFVLVTEEEAAAFRRFTRRPCWAVTNGVDVERFRPGGAIRDAAAVVFVGSLDFPPNIEAAAWFCERVWPHVRRECPGARFHIVGRHPVARVLELGKRAGVEVIADPPDVRPHLARAAAAVAPLRSGGGVKNKILEAWAMRTPVVATRMALAGLAARPGENILAADRPGEFAGAVVRCLHDAGLRESIAARGRETVLAEHTWERAAERFEVCLGCAMLTGKC